MCTFLGVYYHYYVLVVFFKVGFEMIMLLFHYFVYVVLVLMVPVNEKGDDNCGSGFRCSDGSWE